MDQTHPGPSDWLAQIEARSICPTPWSRRNPATAQKTKIETSMINSDKHGLNIDKYGKMHL
jgi:hypothetical protein